MHSITIYLHLFTFLGGYNCKSKTILGTQYIQTQIFKHIKRKKNRFNKIFLGPEQMAALLGPSWKSRQPRMCQYCNRMFSNKFNLKQVLCSVLLTVFSNKFNLKKVLCSVLLTVFSNKFNLKQVLGSVLQQNVQ